MNASTQDKHQWNSGKNQFIHVYFNASNSYSKIPCNFWITTFIHCLQYSLAISACTKWVREDRSELDWKCVRAGLIWWLDFSCSQTGPPHLCLGPVEAQVSNKPYYILIHPGWQVWMILEAALWGASEDVQKADGSLACLEKSGPLKSNRPGTQPLISQAMDLKSPAQAQQLAHCFETHLQFPKEIDRIHSLLWRSPNAEHGKNKIPNQRGSNIQSQGTWNQLKYPPLLATTAHVLQKGPRR